MPTKAREPRDRPFDPRTALREYDDVFLACRDIRHRWEVVGYYRANGAVHRLLRCERCETEREVEWDPRTGELLGARYVYPEGYQFTGSVRGVAPADVRREATKRADIAPSRAKLLESLTS